MICNDSIGLQMVVIDDLTDKENVLQALSCFYDCDFNGENGEEFTSEKAIEAGFESTQEYVIDKLRKSNLNGEALISAYLDEWLGNDGYYLAYAYDIIDVDDKHILAVTNVCSD